MFGESQFHPSVSELLSWILNVEEWTHGPGGPGLLRYHIKGGVLLVHKNIKTGRNIHMQPHLPSKLFYVLKNKILNIWSVCWARDNAFLKLLVRYLQQQLSIVQVNLEEFKYFMALQVTKYWH